MLFLRRVACQLVLVKSFNGVSTHEVSSLNEKQLCFILNDNILAHEKRRNFLCEEKHAKIAIEVVTTHSSLTID
jgi:hypothetical protein